MAIKTLFFDFDGVIADSLDVKSQAFYRIYEIFGKEIAKKVVRHHLDNGGMSRFEKFRYYHREFLHQTINEDEVQKLAGRFSELVVEGVIAAPFVEGITEFLENYAETYQCFIITGTPTDEMRYITKMRGIEKYFTGTYGSPQKKDFWVKDILQKEKFDPNHCVFIGDALSDYHAAVNNFITFILREHPDNLSLFNGKELIRIHNFNNFNTLIQSL